MLTAVSYSQNDCKKYRNGTFKLVDKNSGTVYLIKRKGNIQYEEIEGESDVYTFHVNWTSDCRYTLNPTKETLEKSELFGGTILVEITEIRENTIVLKTTMKEHPDFVLSTEVQVLE